MQIRSPLPQNGCVPIRRNPTSGSGIPSVLVRKDGIRYPLLAMRKVLIIFFLGQGLYLAAGTKPEPEPCTSCFDFSHVKLAIEYFDAPRDSLLAEIAATPAALHLKRHSDRTGYYSAGATPREITNDLVEKTPSPETLNAVRDLVRYADKNPARQKACGLEAAAHLPEEVRPNNPLYITWGYDIGVAMDDRASLNFTHTHFLENREEIWFYCIHEVHHTGVMQIHPMPDKISDIDTVQELYDFARYATFLEGLAVHAARDARREASALGHDRDYLALEDVKSLDRIVGAYWKNLSFLKSEIGVPLNKVHWQVVEDMSSGDRLWYVAGAAMAAEIESHQGRGRLLEVIRQGPDAFFAAYQNIGEPIK